MKINNFLLMTAIPFLLSITARADVIIKSKATVGPMLGIGTSESDITTYIKGDKNRTDTKTTFEGQLFTKAKPEDKVSSNTEIYRLDKEIKWNLESRNNTYREIYLGSLRPPAGDAGQASEADDYTWQVEYNIADKGEAVNGFNCKKAVIDAVGINKSDESDSMFVRLQIWKSEQVPGLDEIEQYYRNLAEITGFDEDSGTDKIKAYSAGFGNEFAESAEKIEEMDGFTVKTAMRIQKSSGGDNQGSGKMNMSDLMKGMFGNDSDTSDGTGAADTRITILSITENVESVDDSSIDDDMFEIPEGYQRAE